jgi:PAS domain S-box-containing protein
MVTDKFEKGDFNARSEYKSTNEIGILAKTFNLMATSVQTELTIQADVAEISQILMKEDELSPFCKTTIAYLLSKIDAQVGVVYLLDESKRNFEHFESIGMDVKNMKTFSVEATEGQFGTVVFEKKIQRIPNIPSESIFSLPTILGNINPREIISVPIIDSNEVVAIISLASVKGFSISAVRLFEEIMVTLTARFNGVVSFQKTKDFAERIDYQNRELEKSKDELAKASQYNRSLIEANIDPLVTIGPDGKITDVNKSTENVTGRTREQLIGSDFSDYFTDPENAKAGYKKVFNDGFVRDYELAIRHANGDITPVFYNASVYKDEKGQVIGIFAAARDISERKQTEQELNSQYKKLEAQTEELQSQSEELQTQSEELRSTSEELQEQNVRLAAKSIEVEEANRLKSEFLSNMSHELRTPLNSIMALSNVLIQRSKNKLSNEENSYLEIIERNGRNLLKLINDILDLSKIEAGKVEISLKQTNIATLLENVHENLRPLATKKGLDFTIQVQDNIPLVETDEARLQQVLTNIIGNALKFTEKGQVSINTETVNDCINISISDTGIGIPKSDLPHIFDKFRQVDGTSSRTYEGTGLGLSIVFEQVNIIGGKINVESEIGKGSVFTISIPIKWKGEFTNRFNEEFHPSILVSDKKTILVVDDDPHAVNEISSFLEDIGYNAIGTTMATDAVRLAEKYRPFAITLDVIMPELDGWEILQRLKKNPNTKDIAVIIVSVSSDKETGIALGAVGHITKPVEKASLLDEIRRLHSNPYEVMIVDDNEIDLEVTSDILQTEGLKVIKANGGKHCIELITKNIPDILILDLMMPETDGFQVLDFVRSREDTKNIPVIIVTAKDITNDDKLVLSGKVSSILHKNETRTNEVMKEIKRTIYELEKNYSYEKPENDTKKNILIVEDNEEAIVQIKSLLESAGYEIDIALGGEMAIEHLKNKTPDAIILDLMMPIIDGFEVLESLQSKSSTAKIPVLVLSAKDLSGEEIKRLNSYNVQQLVQKGAIDIENLLRIIQKMTTKTDKNVFITSSVKNSNAQKRSKVTGDKIKVLVIEDNPDNMVTIKAILGEEYIISEAYDGIEGLNKTLTELPDIILLDISLPKMNGFEVLEEIRKNPEAMHINVIAVTAKAMKQDKEDIQNAGFDGYITKPIDADVLISKIKEVLFNE